MSPEDRSNAELAAEDDDETRKSVAVSTEFGEDGALLEVAGTLTAGEDEERAELEIEYDEDGRIARLTNEDGDRWEVTYASADPIACLANRFVGQSDDVEAREPIGDMDLDGDRVPLGAEHDGGVDRCEHARPLNVPRRPRSPRPVCGGVAPAPRPVAASGDGRQPRDGVSQR